MSRKTEPRGITPTKYGSCSGCRGTGRVGMYQEACTDCDGTGKTLEELETCNNCEDKHYSTRNDISRCELKSKEKD